MPTPVRFLNGRVKADYEVSISWDFEAKLSDLPPGGVKFGTDKLGSVPLRGDWNLRIRSKGDELRFDINYGSLAYAAFGERVTVTGEFAYLANGALRQVDTVSWAAEEPEPARNDKSSTHDGYRFQLAKGQLAADETLPHGIQSSIQQCRFSVTMTQEPEDVARLFRTPTPDVTKALQLANLSHSPLMDVRLLFKQADSRELELWTTADFLGKASAYYKALFSSGAAETVTRSRPKRARGPSVTSVEQKPLAGATRSDPKIDWEDSDDEADTVLAERDWMKCTTTKQDTAELDYQQIEVRETAYSTMCAVLLNLQTGHINFAPLRSSHALPPDELVLERKAALVDALEEDPTLPPPVSPKSVYRLAHLLEREELQKLALDAFASDLTISGAAAELFSPVSLAYDQLRKLVLDFVVKNWKKVRTTEAWEAAWAKTASAPSEGATQIFFDLFAAIENT